VLLGEVLSALTIDALIIPEYRYFTVFLHGLVVTVVICKVV
jgi:hypothetical protein